MDKPILLMLLYTQGQQHWLIEMTVIVMENC